MSDSQGRRCHRSLTFCIRVQQLAGLLFVLSSVSSAWALRAQYISFPKSITTCSLEDRLETIYAAYVNGQRQVRISFDSTGGNLGAALEFVDMLRLLDDLVIAAEVGQNAECSSACVPVFASAHLRRASGEFWVHGLSAHRNRRSVDLDALAVDALSQAPWTQISASGITLSGGVHEFEQRLQKIRVARPGFWTRVGNPDSCALGINRFRCAELGSECTSGPGLEYLAYVAQTSPALAEYVSEFVLGSPEDWEKLTPSRLREIDPNFLND